MKRVLLAVVVASCAMMATTPVFAIKQLSDRFKVIYAGEEANEEFKSLVDEAKCNVCHVKKEKSKKVRNNYGKALHDALEKEEFPIADFKKDPEKYAEEITKIFKKVAEEKSGDEKHKTFADRIKANLLPGGNVDGEME